MPTPQFVLDIRKKIGNDLLWLPGVTAVVLNHDRQILLVRRADDHRWTLVTGVLDPGEQPAIGTVREVYEETGVTVRVERVLRIESMTPTAYPNGDRAQFMDVAFLCTAVAGDARVNDDESVDVGWFDRQSMPALSAREAACVASAFGDTTETWYEQAAY